MMWRKNNELEEAMVANRESQEKVKEALDCPTVGQRVSVALKKMAADTDDALKDVANG